MVDFSIAGVAIEPVKTKPQRLSMLLWGASGAGKTTLACTAPGKKLLILFDYDGDASISSREDVDVLDLSKAKNSVVEMFKSQDNPLSLGKIIDEYDTIIVDSLSAVQHMSVMHAVSTVKGATIERPSLQGYGARNALITQLVKNIIRLTLKHGKHCVFIAHENSPDYSDEGIVREITFMLGGQLKTSAPIDFSECWYVEDTGKTRRIAIRPCRQRKPMKSRMFVTSDAPEFVWKHTGDEIERWFNSWKDAGWIKQPIPT